MGRLFGTDGVRGLANRDLTAELALDLAVAAAHILSERGTFAGHRPRAIVGRDTRISGEFLESAVVAGLASAGVDVYRVGVIPTPGVAYLVNSTEADLGVMISASHNPMPDNGIKFFARGGVKLDDSLEDAIAARLGEEWERPLADEVGRVIDAAKMVDSYIEHLVSSVSASFSGLTFVIDGANGSASRVSPEAFRRLGAKVIEIATEPNGLNINDGVGSTHLEPLISKVKETKAAAGFAHDGDADRTLAVDENGNVVDGDQIIAILALALKEKNRLSNSTVVTTVMSNLGFMNAMKENEINVITTAVGDRYVLEEMRKSNVALGGEQSGHVILAEFAETGDGTLTALSVAAQMAESKRSLSELAAVMIQYPQVLINVSNVDKSRVSELDESVAKVAATLGGQGRVLLRPSGTEPVIRVMVEAATENLAQSTAKALADEVRTRLAL